MNTQNNYNMPSEIECVKLANSVEHCMDKIIELSEAIDKDYKFLNARVEKNYEYTENLQKTLTGLGTDGGLVGESIRSKTLFESVEKEVLSLRTLVHKYFGAVIFLFIAQIIWEIWKN